jgi:hypothetical protein
MLWASGWRIGAGQMFPARLVQKPSSVPTLLPARPSFGYQDNLPVQWAYLMRRHIFIWKWKQLPIKGILPRCDVGSTDSRFASRHPNIPATEFAPVFSRQLTALGYWSVCLSVILLADRLCMCLLAKCTTLFVAAFHCAVVARASIVLHTRTLCERIPVLKNLRK